MTTTTTLPLIPSAIPEGKFAQNGDTGTAPILRRLAAAYNFVSVNQRKQLIAKGMADVSNPSLASEDANHFVFRTGANVESIDFVVAMMPAASTSTAASYVEMTLDDGTTTITSDALYHPGENGVGDDTIQWVRGSITAADGLTADTEYVGYITQENRARVKSVSVFETAAAVADSSDDGVADPTKHEVFRPIEYQSMQELAETGDYLHRLNGAQLISYSSALPSLSPSVSGTTETNILDGSSTAWASTSPGFVLHTQYLDTSDDDVRVTLGVHATRITGTGTLNVQLKRNGSTLISRTGIAPADMAPFYAHNTTLTARASDKVDFHASVTGGGEWRIDAIGIWLYTP